MEMEDKFDYPSVVLPAAQPSQAEADWVGSLSSNSQTQLSLS